MHLKWLSVHMKYLSSIYLKVGSVTMRSFLSELFAERRCGPPDPDITSGVGRGAGTTYFQAGVAYLIFAGFLYDREKHRVHHNKGCFLGRWGTPNPVF